MWCSGSDVVLDCIDLNFAFLLTLIFHVNYLLVYDGLLCYMRPHLPEKSQEITKRLFIALVIGTLSFSTCSLRCI